MRFSEERSARRRVERFHGSYQGQITPAEAEAEVATKKAAVKAVAVAVLMMRRMV